MLAAVIGCYAWPSAASDYWLGQVSWYTSLSLALVAILLSLQQRILLEEISIPTEPSHMQRFLHLLIVPTQNLIRTANQNDRDGGLPHTESSYTINWNMMFVWQCPMMFVSWSWVCFLVGLVLHVCTPLIMDSSTEDSQRKIAVVFLVNTGLIFATFAWCSFWVYAYIDD